MIRKYWLKSSSLKIAISTIKFISINALKTLTTSSLNVAFSVGFARVENKYSHGRIFVEIEIILSPNPGHVLSM